MGCVREEAGPADHEMERLDRLYYLQTAVQLVDRDIAQMLNTPAAKECHPYVTAAVRQFGYTLRRALDIVQGHNNQDLAPCWCSRHWPPEVPIKP